jgi:adenylate cyclase class IV
MLNLELKAYCADNAAAAKIAEELGAQLQWTKAQRDTYFSVLQGKLKLRQSDGEPAQLIAY